MATSYVVEFTRRTSYPPPEVLDAIEEIVLP